MIALDDFFRDGWVLLHATNETQLRALVENFSRDILVHPNATRAPLSADPRVVLVDTDERAISAHSELTYLPRRPELQWFWCITPPEHGGETTLYDGARVWAALPHALRQTFLHKRLRWTLPPLAPHVWQRLFAVAGADEFCARYGGREDFSFSFDALSFLTFEYRVYAHTRAKWRDEKVFTNNILAGGARLSFEDGTPVDGLRELERASESVCREITWHANDVLLVDNTRMMHGRRAFSGARKIAAVISNANF